METWLLIFILVFIALCALAAAFFAWRALKTVGAQGSWADAQNQKLDQLSLASERTERELRNEISGAGRATREELAGNMVGFQQALGAQMSSVATVQNNQIDSFAQTLAALTKQNEAQLDKLREDARLGRDETSAALKRFGDGLAQQFGEVRLTLEARLKDIETQNAVKLEEMRKTVDEKLHATLEQRLGESFKLVSERLEQVHRGLGEMQSLALGVGDLKKLMSGVKTRGTWGEVQLVQLLSELLAPEQFAANVEVKAGSRERVDCAIRLPGQGGAAVWLPIDAKFPLEDYDRIVAAQELGDLAALEEAGRALESRIKLEGKSIRDKYVAPPATTDFAILFLPTEGLYAEVLRRIGLADWLQRECRVVLAGPSTLAALTNALRMGFRTLAIEQRSSEVWQLLSQVKNEFGKFGDVLAKTKKKLEEASNTIGEAEVRTRVIERRLKGVESLEAAGDEPPKLEKLFETPKGE